nr:hypothetical protein CFP56_72360 [Quercus suber]
MNQSDFEPLEASLALYERGYETWQHSVTFSGHSDKTEGPEGCLSPFESDDVMSQRHSRSIGSCILNATVHRSWLHVSLFTTLVPMLMTNVTSVLHTRSKDDPQSPISDIALDKDPMMRHQVCFLASISRVCAVNNRGRPALADISHMLGEMSDWQRHQMADQAILHGHAMQLPAVHAIPCCSICRQPSWKEVAMERWFLHEGMGLPPACARS